MEFQKILMVEGADMRWDNFLFLYSLTILRPSEKLQLGWSALMRKSQT